MKKYKYRDIVYTKENEWDIPEGIKFTVDEEIHDDGMKYVIAYNPRYGFIDFDLNEITRKI